MKEEGRTIGELLQPRREKVLPALHPDLPYIGLEHVEAQTTRLLGSVPAHSMRSQANRFHVGDVLYSRLRPYLNKVWLADREGLCSAEFIVLPGNELIDANFLRYRLSARDFVQFANSLNAGDRPRVDFDQISSFILPPFSLAQQHRIVEKIEELFSELDKGIENLKQARAQLAVYRQALLKHAFEGKLTADWRVTHADQLESADQLLARILSERRKKWQGRGKYQEPTRSAAIESPELPEGWVCVSLGEICHKITDGTHLKPTYTEKGMPFLSVKNVRPGRIRDTDIKYISVEQHADYIKRCRPEKGDILYTKVGATYGYAAINTLDYDFSIYVSLALLKYPQHLIEPKYIEMCMNSPVIYFQAQKRIKGIGRPDLHLEEIRDFHFPLPSLAEQTQIVAELEGILSVIDALESDIDANLQKAEALRQSILKKAFAGELVPQDPADEPASALLARIRAERESAAKAAHAKKQTTVRRKQP